MEGASAELYHLQMQVQRLQDVQGDHADRLLRLERRQADDAALKSVWNSPFPSVLAGTPQQGPARTPSTEAFRDFDDEHGQNILGNLQLDTDDEPVRRGASRANSVRFDVSAIQGSNWAQSSRNSGEFAPARPHSSNGGHPMVERSLSHKSDGRHSSAGHSVHSAPSGRTSSLGLDTNFMIGGLGDESPGDIIEPPPGLFLLGAVPSIIRCWLNQDFSHGSLLYAVVSTGSQKSQLDFGLVKELGLQDELRCSINGSYSIRLPVYLPEAVIMHSPARANSPAPRVPALTANFEVLNVGQRSTPDQKKNIRVFLGSDILRAHGADLFLSRNMMTVYGDDKTKILVPFVRPEDESVFQNLCSANFETAKVELKPNAPIFTPGERQKLEVTSHSNVQNSGDPKEDSISTDRHQPIEGTGRVTERVGENSVDTKSVIEDTLVDGGSPLIKPGAATPEESALSEKLETVQNQANEQGHSSSTTPAKVDRRDSASGIWSSWRAGNDEGGRNLPLGNYQRPGRVGKTMRVLKPSKVSQSTRLTSGARTGPTYEAPPSRISDESRRRRQNSPPDTLRWDAKKVASEEQASAKENMKLPQAASRSSNPIGGASAFGWMKAGRASDPQIATD